MGSKRGKEKNREEEIVTHKEPEHHTTLLKNKISGETTKNKQTGRTTPHTNFIRIFFSVDFMFLLTIKYFLRYRSIPTGNTHSPLTRTQKTESAQSCIHQFQMDVDVWGNNIFWNNIILDFVLFKKISLNLWKGNGGRSNKQTKNT